MKSSNVSRQTHLKEMLLIGLLGSIPRKPGMLLRRWFYRHILAGIGESVLIERGCEFFGAGHVEIGNHVFISHHVYCEASQSTNRIVIGDCTRLGDNIFLSTSGEHSSITIGDDVILDRGIDVRPFEYGQINIGKGTFIGPYGCLAGPGKIEIGADCLIAAHAGIYANNHNFSDPTRRICTQGFSCKGIVIEDDCWLGDGVKVLDGVTIGRGSIIGAGAVVTKDIPPHSIAVGVPAKVIGQRSSNVRSSMLMELDKVKSGDQESRMTGKSNVDASISCNLS